MFKWKRIIVLLSVALAVYVAVMFYCYARQGTSSDYQKPTKTNARQSNTTQNLPDALVIGVKKGGTRALLEYLDMHPQVAFCPHEIKFFNENYDRGLQWYKKQMPYSVPGQLTMEKTPTYFVKPYVPERIYEMNHKIKLILTVRDPVERLISDYTHRVHDMQDDKPLEELVLDKHGKVNIDYAPVLISVYYIHMEEWLKVFKRKRIHIVDGDNLTENPFQEMTKIEEFLGIERIFTRNNFQFNEIKGFYCYKTAKQEKCLGESKGRAHPEIDPTVIKKLRQFFKPFNEMFFELVGRQFDWPSV